jgi:peptide deformylase
MILPIVAYGDPVLNKRADEIVPGQPGIDQLIADMFETMYDAHGVGLAAPQVGKSVRLFVVDASPFTETDEEDEDGEIDERAVGLENFKKVFINPVIHEETGDKWGFREGCLSIPGVREEVSRNETIRISWLDEHFKPHQDEFSGYAARVIQHEYDHLEGVLFTERINPFRRRLLKGKLTDISRGKVDVDYRMRFYSKSR